jgi:hypothetical protein
VKKTLADGVGGGGGDSNAVEMLKLGKHAIGHGTGFHFVGLFIRRKI